MSSILFTPVDFEKERDLGDFWWDLGDLWEIEDDAVPGRFYRVAPPRPQPPSAYSKLCFWWKRHYIPLSWASVVEHLRQRLSCLCCFIVLDEENVIWF
jgi:hypothetical protein